MIRRRNNPAKFAATLVALCSWQAAGATLAFAAETAAAPPANDEQTIRLQAQEYLTAFKNGDAKKLAAMWTTEGTLVDISGREFHGRADIEKQFAKFFELMGKQPLEVNIESIRFPVADVAIEEGSGKLANSPSPADMCRYQVVHVKKDGQWQMASVTERPFVAADGTEYLKDLSWLVGDWKAQGPAGSMRFSANWVANKNFISCGWYANESQQPSQVVMIGWDPAAEKISSWHFGGDGGSGHGTWSKDKNSWLVSARAVQPGGAVGRASYIFRRVDDNNFSWKAERRSVNGIEMPASDEIKVARIPK